MQSGRAAIDVIVAGAAGRELEPPEAKADSGKQSEEQLGMGGRNHRF
jgi:hypothetical protein